MLLDIQQTDGTVTISHYNDEGKTAYKTYKLDNMTNWSTCDANSKQADKTFKNWDGRGVKKSRGRTLNKFSMTYFLENLPKEDDEEIFSYNFPNIYFFDIEVGKYNGVWSDATEAAAQVLTISLVTPEKKVIVMGLKDLVPSSQKKILDKTNKYFEKFGDEWEFVYKKFEIGRASCRERV